MKLIASFNDDCIINSNDLDDLVCFLEQSSFIHEVFLEYSLSELAKIDFKEDENDS